MSLFPDRVQKHWHEVTLGILAVFFAASTSILVVANRLEALPDRAKFDWPDETANFYFAERIAGGKIIQEFDPLIGRTKNRLHPRSFNVLDSSLVPGGFLGLPLIAGLVGIIFGAWGILLLAPALAIGGVLSLVSISRRLFGEQVGWLTGVLAFTNPVLIYYTAYVMLPNVAFVSFLLLGMAATMSAEKGNGAKGRGLAVAVLGGLCVGLALFVRTNEIWWVGPLFVATLAASRAKLGWGRVALAILGAALVGAVILALNARVYGDPLAAGYTRFADSGAASNGPTYYILPFGFHPRLAWHNIWNYFFKDFWWVVAPMMLGFGTWISYRRKSARQIFFAAMLAVAAVWLFVYYGSWSFDDPLTTRLNTIGISYVRYWLPLTLGALPFAALFVWSLGCVRGVRRGATMILVVVMTALSIRTAFFSGPDSLLPVAVRIREYHRAAAAVAAATPSASVIVTWRTDKIIFPERRVVAADLQNGLDSELAGLIVDLDQVSWFLYARLSAEEEAKVKEDLGRVALTMDSVGDPRPGETLYRIRKKL